MGVPFFSPQPTPSIRLESTIWISCPSAPLAANPSASAPIKIPTPALPATFGFVEQNVFVPVLHHDPSLAMTTAANAFRRSPLFVVSLGPLKEGVVIAAHEDTMELL